MLTPHVSGRTLANQEDQQPFGFHNFLRQTINDVPRHLAGDLVPLALQLQEVLVQVSKSSS
jgi:hypothetical protein